MASHSRVYVWAKPYRCTLCLFRPATPRNLLVHYGVHAGKKPYECVACGCLTARKGRLVRPHACAYRFSSTLGFLIFNAYFLSRRGFLKTSALFLFQFVGPQSQLYCRCWRIYSAITDTLNPSLNPLQARLDPRAQVRLLAIIAIFVGLLQARLGYNVMTMSRFSTIFVDLCIFFVHFALWGWTNRLLILLFR